MNRVSFRPFSWALLATLWASASQAAFVCPKDAKLIAAELLELDLSGLRLQKRSHCLKESGFKYVQVFHDPTGEAPEGGLELLSDSVRIIIDRVEHDGEAEEEVAHFTVVPDSGAAPVKDSFRFVIHQSELRRQKDGCGDLLGFPKRWRVRGRCSP